MNDTLVSIQDFLNVISTVITTKHNQGVYNTVCLVVLLSVPLLVLLITLAVCCHCCCCRHANCCCCCCGGDTMATTRSDTKKKKNGDAEDLWISVKTGPMAPDRLALEMV